jgi:hypothetical protein
MSSYLIERVIKPKGNLHECKMHELQCYCELQGGDLNGLSLQYKQEVFPLTRNFNKSLTAVSASDSKTLIQSV